MGRVRLGVLFTLPILVIATSILFLVNDEVIRHPMLSVIFATLLFYGYILLPTSPPNSVSIGSKSTSLLDFLIFLCLAVLAYLSLWFSGQGITPLLLIGAGSVITWRILVGRTRLTTIIIQIILVGIIARTSLYFSYPVYGPDMFHRAIPGYIMATGELIPSEIHYYRSYPLSHLLTAFGGLITKTEAPFAMFLFVGIVQSISYVGVYILTNRLIGNQRYALLAMLATTLAAGPLLRGSQLFAQTYAGAVFALFLWTLLPHNKRRLIVVYMLFMFVAFLGHHSLAFTLSLVLLGLFTARIVTEVLNNYEGNVLELNMTSILSSSPNPIIPFLFFSVLFLYYWISIGQLQGQVNRVILITSFGTLGGQEVVDEAAVPPTIDILGQTLPAVLSWSAPILVFVVISGLVFYIIIYNTLLVETESGVHYTLMALGFFGVFAISYVVGGRTSVIRLLPELTVIVTPLLGIIGCFYKYRWGGKAITGILCICVISAGFLTPAVAIPDRSDDVYKPVSSSDEVKAAHWADEHAESIGSDKQLIGYLYWNKVSQGKHPNEDRYNRLLNENSPSDISDYEEWSERGPFIYRDYFIDFYPIDRPDTENKIFDAGNTSAHI